VGLIIYGHSQNVLSGVSTGMFGNITRTVKKMFSEFF
jgi:hypothetical protein